MQYRIEDHRIVAYDTNHPFVGELTFPAVPDENKRVVLEHVFVDPKFRGQGIAQALVQHFVDYATKQDYTVKLMCPFASLNLNNIQNTSSYYCLLIVFRRNFHGSKRTKRTNRKRIC